MKILRTRMLGFAWTLMLVAVLAPGASAQVPLKRQLGQLSFLVGEWQGTGWVRFEQNGPMHPARATARGEPSLSGLVLSWYSTYTSAHGKREVLTAYELGIRFRADSSVFRGGLNNRWGPSDDTSVTVGECQMEWGYAVTQSPHSLFRTRIRVSGRTLSETGERSDDGGRTWWTIYTAEMTGSRLAGCAAPAPAAGPESEGERAAAG